MSAVQKFIASARQLHAEETDPAKRWEKMTPLLEELIADPAVREQSKQWPDCSQGGERAENLLFYEDPDYKFVINGLIKAPHTRTAIHDHAHNWTLYGVLDGSESIERYERVDDQSKPDYAEVRKSVNVKVECRQDRPGAALCDSRRGERRRTDSSDHRTCRKGRRFSPGTLRPGDQQILAGLRT